MKQDLVEDSELLRGKLGHADRRVIDRVSDAIVREDERLLEALVIVHALLELLGSQQNFDLHENAHVLVPFALHIQRNSNSEVLGIELLIDELVQLELPPA